MNEGRHTSINNNIIRIIGQLKAHLFELKSISVNHLAEYDDEISDISSELAEMPGFISNWKRKHKVD